MNLWIGNSCGRLTYAPCGVHWVWCFICDLSWLAETAGILETRTFFFLYGFISYYHLLYMVAGRS